MICTELMGGMGNQMFQYALGRHLSIKYNTDLFLDLDFLLDRTPRENFVYRNYDLGIFNIQEKFAPLRISKIYGMREAKKENIFQKILRPSKLKYIKEDDFKFRPEILDVGNNLYLSGHWQTEKYFTEVEQIIRQDFTFKRPLGIKASEMAKTIENCNSVCLNVRRGDFVNNPMHTAMGAEYYTKAENYIRDKLSKPVIFVFSDEVDWCKANLKIASEAYFIAHDFAGEKFRDYLELMSRCKHFIIPNSTFAWWAAWLCSNYEKIVVAPEVWFQSGYYSYRDIVPETWIRL